MRINSPTRYATLAALVGALACASNTARTDESAAAKDTTTTGRDTLNGQNENPPGYRGMERDTAGYSGIERDTTHRDTTGVTNQPSQTDTSSMRTDTSSMRSDTTGAGGVTDTTGRAADTSGYNQSTGRDTSAVNPSETNPSSGAATGLDSTGQSKTGDTTGYGQSQQQRDSTSR